MNPNTRLVDKDIVSNELLGGDFERFVTYKTDGTLLIENTSEFVPGVGLIPGQKVSLQNWEEITRLRDYLNKLEPVHKEESELERTSA